MKGPLRFNMCRSHLLLSVLASVFLTACSSTPLKPGNIKYFAKERIRGPIVDQQPSKTKRVKKDINGWTVLSNSPAAMNDYFASLRTNEQGVARNVDIIVRMPHCWLLVACESKDTLYQPKASKLFLKKGRPLAKDP